MSMGGYDEYDDPPGSNYLTHYEAANVAEPIRDWFHFYSVTATSISGFARFDQHLGLFSAP